MAYVDSLPISIVTSLLSIPRTYPASKLSTELWQWTLVKRHVGLPSHSKSDLRPIPVSMVRVQPSSITLKLILCIIFLLPLRSYSNA